MSSEKQLANAFEQQAAHAREMYKRLQNIHATGIRLTGDDRLNALRVAARALRRQGFIPCEEWEEHQAFAYVHEGQTWAIQLSRRSADAEKMYQLTQVPKAFMDLELKKMREEEEESKESDM